ncbi:bacterial regulatory helix-turn-helix, lysR family protein, partial [Vibrio parahaemolyticus V-223/04]
WKVSTH